MLSFSFNFLSILVHIPGSIEPITLIWVSLERSFPPGEVEHKWCQVWSEVMTSDVEQGPSNVTAGTGQTLFGVYSFHFKAKRTPSLTSVDRYLIELHITFSVMRTTCNVSFSKTVFTFFLSLWIHVSPFHFSKQYAVATSAPTFTPVAWLRCQYRYFRYCRRYGASSYLHIGSQRLLFSSSFLWLVRGRRPLAHDNLTILQLL